MGQSNEHEFNRTFRRELMSLVIPISFQNLISAAVNSADVIMLSMINQAAMSAVSLAGQVTFVLTLFYFGLGTGTGILTAQYWGKKDIKAINHVLTISATFTIAISLIFFIASVFFPEALMNIYTNDAELIRYGKLYLRPIALTYLAMSLSQIYLNVLKSMENARLSAWISSSCLILNILLDALCVFVLFPGRPEKAIIGVAFATVIARFVELAWCILHSVTKGKVRFHLPEHNSTEHSLRKDYLKYTLPVLANYIIWGGALTATATIIGHVSADMVAANSIASVVKNLAVIFCGGIASGGAVLIGKYLGQGNSELAKKAGNKINTYAFLFGIIAGITVLLLKPLVFHIVSLNDAATTYLNGMLYICAYYCIGKSINSTNIGGIFCAGGDSKFGFWCDTIVMWVIVIPLSLLSAFVWNIPPIWLYAVICMDEIIKLPLSLIRYRQYRWLKNITREFE